MNINFGFHVHRVDDVAQAAKIGYTTIRLWDAGVDRASMQPASTAINYSLIDSFINAAEGAGLKISWTVGLTPQWDSARPNELSSYGPGQAAEPVNLIGWTNYIKAIVTKYKGRIYAYEPWNEVSFPHDPHFTGDSGGVDNNFFTGNASKMVELAKVVYTQVKAIDPSALVLTPSFHCTGDWGEKFNYYLAQGGKQYCDVVSQHYYFDPAPESIMLAMNFMKDTSINNGIGHLPIWNTEVGRTFPENVKNYPGLSLPEVVYALTLRTYLINAAMGLESVYWYAWDNDVMGVHDASGKDFGSAACKAVVQLLKGLSTITLTNSNNLYTATLKTDKGHFKARWIGGIKPKSRSLKLTHSASKWGMIPNNYPAGTVVSIGAVPVLERL
jgi:hypothetical protein